VPIVDYGKYRVSDQRLRDTLEKIATETGQVLRVTSGDRDFVPKGGAKKSLHLINEAVDFHGAALTDEMLFTVIRLKRRQIFGDAVGNSFRFQIIRHGAYTETQGAHIHLGYVPENFGSSRRGFMVEGITPATKGHYSILENP
jgi:hypothetical protein